MEYIVFDDNDKPEYNMNCLKDYSSRKFISYVKKKYNLINVDNLVMVYKFKCIVIQGPWYHDEVLVNVDNDDLKKYIVMDVIPYKNKHNFLSKILDFL